jgi:type IV pilus assembly protein PilC
MAVFGFQAKAEDGRIVKGELDAANEFEARIRLRAQRMTPLKLAPRSSGPDMAALQNLAGMFAPKVSQKDLQVFTRQFSVLVGAGVPIVQGLEAMTKGARSPAMTLILKKITAEVERGRPLAEALSTAPTVFDRLYVNLIRAGEEGGVLEVILLRLAEYIEKSVKLKAKVKSALVYPVAIVFVAILVVTFIMIFVVPKMAEMFKSNGQTLPTLTIVVMKMSDAIAHYWYMFGAVLFGTVIGLKMYYDTEPGRKLCDAILIEIPVIGDLIKKSGIARFARTLSTLLTSGVRIIDALEISSTTTGNWMLEKALLEAKDAVSRGQTLAEPLVKIPYFPNMVTQMISIGEQTGNMDAMLGKVADFYEDEVETATDTMTSLMEPILMVVLGGIVGTIVVAMYLPIFGMANGIK